MTVGAWITLGLTILASLITIGTLIYKYAQVVADVKSNKKEITEMKETVKELESKHDNDVKLIKDEQKEYQKAIEKSVCDIKELINSMDKSLKVLAVKFEYETKGVDDGK